MGKTILKNRLSSYNYFELGINVKYAVSAYQLGNIRKWLNRKSIDADYLYNDQSEYLISIRAYPFWMENFFGAVGSYDKFPIGPFSAKDVNCLGKKLTFQKAPVLLAEMDVPRKYNNYMDFAPYTNITAYIPYISFVSLHTNEIMGKHIKFYAQVDFDNGLMTVWVECENTMIQSWETPIGIDITLNRTNGTDWARNMYLWGIKAVTTTGGLMLGADADGTHYGKSVKAGGDLGISGIGANQHHVYRGGYSTGINKLYNPTSIYLIFERDIPIEKDVETNNGENTYASIYGLPLMKSMFISSLSGYTVINDVHLDNFVTAYDNEKNEIETLLRNGVIL